MPERASVRRVESIEGEESEGREGEESEGREGEGVGERGDDATLR